MNRVLVVGDVVDDIVVIPRTPIRPDTDTAADIRPRPGGSAANTAAWLGFLGTPVDFVGAVAAGDVDRHAAEFRAHGVAPHLAAVDHLPPSTIVVLVENDRRTMLTERGANAALDDADVSDVLLRSAAMLHLTGFSLLDGPGVSGVRRLIERAHACDSRVSMGAGSAGFLADRGPAAFREGVAGADLLLAGLDEGRLLAGRERPEDVVAALARDHPVVVLTLGAAGVLVAAGGSPVALPAEPAEVLDPTGAGDAFAAGFLHGWVGGADPVDAAREGLRTAARALAVIGGRPPPPVGIS